MSTLTLFRAALEEPEPRHTQIKESKAGSRRRHRMASPLSLRRQLSRLPPKDIFTDMMFVGQLLRLL